MSDTSIKDVVKEKYGQAALRVTSWGKWLLRGHGIGRIELRSNHIKSLRCSASE